MENSRILARKKIQNTLIMKGSETGLWSNIFVENEWG
jgi:hypothetical protein